MVIQRAARVNGEFGYQCKRCVQSKGLRIGADEIMVRDFAPRVTATYNSFLESDAASRTIAWSNSRSAGNAELRMSGYSARRMPKWRQRAAQPRSNVNVFRPGILLPN